mgnify:CR=1 FL=1
MKLLMEQWKQFVEAAETEGQKNFMHAVKDCKEDGDCPSDNIEKAAGSMTTKQIKDYTTKPVKEELDSHEDKTGDEVTRAHQSELDAATKLSQISKEQIEEMVRQELEEDCWTGHQRVPGTEKGAPGSCEKKTEEKQIEEGEICDAGITYVLRTDPGGKDIHRGDKDTDGDGEKEIKNWSARAAQIASKYCKDPDYGKGRGKDAKDEQLTNEGDLAAWGEKEKWTHSDGTPCGGGDKDGSQSRCKPKAKWKTMTKGEKAADNAKKKAGTKAGKQNVPATEKGKVTKAYTKRDESLQLTEEHIEEIVNNIMTQIEEGGQCTGPTQKASSTSKGKKWMQCVKNPDGKGYKRIHWGQKGVRVTGDSGNTKRKKSFRARHGCKDAKAGTAKYMACKDW